MALVLDENNYQEFLSDPNHLEFNSSFYEKYNLEDYTNIEIKGIKNETLYLKFFDINLNGIELKIIGCHFSGILIHNSQLSELTINTVTVSEFIEDDFKMFKTVVCNSKIDNFRCYYSTFYSGFLIQKSSISGHLTFNDSNIEYRFTSDNSELEELWIESSTVERFEIQRVERKEEDDVGNSEVKKINLFRSTFQKTIRITDTSFNSLNIHKIDFLKSQELDEHFNSFHVRTPNEKSNVIELNISNSQIAPSTTISVQNIENIKITDCTFGPLRINFTQSEEHIYSGCEFLGRVYWGLPQRLKRIKKFFINDCLFQNQFYLRDFIFLNRLEINSSSFQYYPSFFSNNYIKEECTTDFSYSSLNNFVFDNINFENFHLGKLDVTNVEFQNCEWPHKKEMIADRYQILDEKKSKSLKNLIITKALYSDLKSNFKKKNDYLSAGKFHISEQETKRRIAILNRSYFEYFLMSFHKYISSYGENFRQPLLLAIATLFIFSFIYLFTGFQSGENYIEYQFSLSLPEFKPLLNNWGQALLFSLKNVFPFSVNNNFFLSANANTPNTQVLELVHRIINIIFATSFTAALLKYLKK